ncbi:MAG TPA: hypothetical protein VGH90_12480 [Chthoniobacteraceae bacterium]
MKDGVHRDDVERRVVAERPQRDARVLIDVAFSDFDEAAEFCKTRQTHRNRFAGECVQDDVDTFPISEVHYRLGEIAATRVDHIFDAKRFEQTPFAWAARTCDHLRSEVARNLDRRHSDSARAGMDENSFALAQTRDVLQRVPGSHEDHRQSGSSFKSEPSRNAPDVARARDRLSRKTKNSEPKYSISRNDVSDGLTDRPNDTGNFVTKNSRIRSVTRIKRESLEHVAEIHSRSFDFDQHLPWFTRRELEGSKAQRVEVAAFASFEAQ